MPNANASPALPNKKSAAYNARQASPDFAAIERDILAYWEKERAFEKSIDNRDEAQSYVFYDGPPFANGLPHYGHLLTGYVKDSVARYQTMRGQKVERRFGWDCHGLPAEMGAEKELGISGRKQITDYGIDKFNDTCRESVMQFAGQWEEYVTRQGRWVDFQKGYKTMDRSYMESVLWAFKQLYDKGLIYQSVRVMPYSWAAETPLSNFETRLDNSYRERTDKTATVLFELKEVPIGLEHPELNGKSIKIAAWTTTPWTLPSNLALAVNPEMEYHCIVRANDALIYSVHNYYGNRSDEGLTVDIKSSDPKEVLKYNKEKEGLLSAVRFKGADLAGLTYEPLFPYFKDHQNAFRIIAADFVTEGDGTGIVHLAPGFGEDDQRVCAEAGIDVVCPVDESGKYTDEIFNLDDLRLKGLNVLSATEKCDAEPYNDEQLKKYGLVNLRIINWLKSHGKLLKQEDVKHNYPHCWRTDTPLIYKAVPSWYVQVSAFKDRMVELNQNINWIPSHIKDGQFGKWLENARDWSISRNRFWGTPIPIWQTETGKTKAFGSIEELEEFFGREVSDLHRPFIDSLVKTDEDGTWRRVTDVFDCWFESGAMPFAQQHYPFNNKGNFEANFPADFIVEYVAQTRGWFYTLMVLSTALFDKEPFKNCICHGVVLDENGQKLSKKLQNYADPRAVFEQYGSDALRWVMLSSPIMQGGDLLIDKECNMVRDAVRLAIKPAWNAFHFFALYANADGITARFDASSGDMMDKYILSECRRAAENIREELDGYRLPGACKAFEDFFEILNNWYIRRSKERFWKSEHDGDKIAAYNTLYSVLSVMSRASAPLLPFLSEAIWQGLGNTDSVHWQDFPTLENLPNDVNICDEMKRVRDICNAALSVRNKEKVRIRQPLALLTVIDPRAEKLRRFEAVITEELNVKTVVFSSDVQEKADKTLKIIFPVLGKRLPGKIKDVIASVKKGEWTNENGAVTVCRETLLPEEYELLLQPKAKRGAAPLSTQDGLVELDLTVTEELRLEGIMRDVVRLIQQSRKTADLAITDRITLYLHSDSDAVTRAVTAYNNHICEQTLADDAIFTNAMKGEARFIYDYDVEGAKLTVGITLT